jgi:U3 small nucleolar RNA-associated protein 21
LRIFHIFRDRQNTELSQGHIEKKAKRMKVAKERLRMPTIISFDYSVVREKDWDNIVSCHKMNKKVRTWNFSRLAIGKNKFSLANNPTTAAISSCGNFGIVGDQGGYISKFNIQSAIFRGRVDDEVRHNKAVTFVTVDLINSFIISSSLDSTLKV